MAYYVEEDEYNQDLPEATDEHHMEERLVEALGFGQCDWRARSLPDSGSQHDQPSDVGFARGASKVPASSADILAHMAASVIKDHEYCSFQALEVPESGLDSSILTEGVPSSDSHSSGFDQEQDGPKPSGKRKRKSRNVQESVRVPRLLSFDPESIILLCSTEWIPCAEVAHYVQDRIRKGFDRDLRNTLRSESPHPSLLGKVADIRELDPNMATFIKRFSKDLKKSLDLPGKAAMINC
ncbi:hypothetical protein NDU88_003461 [Pleurodeles waltl]|uniref:Uncharacterized protein n=1 Tax=Pleurodeles waltl TaxID=8319 RepID=A0AAV7UCJ2_PLEWA|nr:hypothetical protein NDU88_003461 [Pleurodeles waltl]